MGAFHRPAFCFLVCICLSSLYSCGAIKKTYDVVKGTFTTSYQVTTGVVKTVLWTGEVVYKIGEYTFKVVKAPMNWPLMREEIETIDGMSPKEAIQKGKVKNAPYVVFGKRYVPMSVEDARTYKEKGVASWYGYETRQKKGGHMTANGEAFDPEGLTAAHKHLPLPVFVRVTNLENQRSVIVRVNDRGPFVPGRIIDMSAGTAKRLGFYQKGTARVLVETIEVEA